MSASRAPTRSRLRLLPELAAIVALGWLLYAVLKALEGGRGLLAFERLLERAPDEPLFRLLWLLGDTNEAQFYASFVAGGALLAGAFVAYRLDRAGSRWRGFPITYGTGLWPWVLAASLLGLALSVAVYGFVLADGEWVPTFVPFVSIPAGIVLIYGAGWRTALTGAILGGFIGFPIAYATIEWILTPLAFPAVIGNVTGMWLGGIIAFELCHRALPWMRRQEQAPLEEGDIPERAPEPYEEAERSAMDRPGWLARRTLADFTEAQFYGNELASAALILGVIVSWALDSRESVYGTELLPAVLVSQVMAAALGIVLYHDRWRRLEWYPTFVPVVSVAPAVVLSFGGGVAQIIAGSVLGAVIGPPIAQFIIDRIPAHWHLYIGNTLSMAISTAVVVALLLPLPGFDL